MDPRTVTCTEDGTVDASLGDGARLPRGATIGRYVILELLGEGGMGEVYAAFDYALDRKVALKRVASHGAGAKERVHSEARAMARLSHPHITTVYDVVEDAARELFIAMELVGAGTLEGWLAGAPRTTDAILDVFLQAGRGLHAAHEVGIVHRDFKPRNVLIGSDGRARVSDFGLARAAGAPGSARVGTPRYMPPEQRRGEPATPLSDQYSFCVALREALAPPRKLGRTLARALERGTAEDARGRHRSMIELLRIVEASRRGQRRAVIAVGAALAVAGGVAWWSARAPADPCLGSGSRAAEVWDLTRRTALHLALARARPTSTSLAERVYGTVDGYVESYRALSVTACRATRVDAVQTPGELVARQRCLDDGLLRARALVEVLADAEAPQLPLAVVASRNLPPLTDCLGVKPRPSGAAAEARDAATVEQLQAQVFRAEALNHAGSPRVALPLAEEVARRAHELGLVCIEADALVQLAQAQEDRTASSLDSLATLSRALVTADACGDEDPAIRAHLRMTWILAAKKNDPRGAEEHLDHARALLARRGAQSWGLGARVGLAEGRLRLAEGRTTEAAEFLAATLERSERQLGFSHPTCLLLAQELVQANLGLGRTREARALLERIQGAEVEALGADHPSVADTDRVLAELVANDGDESRALELLRTARAIHERASGPAHSTVAVVEVDEGNVLTAFAHVDEALAREEHARAMFVALSGPAATIVGLIDNNIGDTLVVAGRLREALERYRQADATYRQAAPGHTDRVTILSSLGLTSLRLLDTRAARRDCEAAWALAVRTGVQALPIAGPPLRCLAEVELQTGRAASALPRLRKALDLLRGGGGSRGERGLTQFALARALVATGDTGPPVDELVQEARQALGTPALRSAREDLERFVRKLAASQRTAVAH